MSNRNKNVVVVGCGYWGKNLIRNFHEIGALYGVCDTDSKVTQTKAKEYDVTPMSWQEVLLNEEVEALAIAAPAAQHYRLAKEALLAGKHIFVEKPLSLDLGEAEELYEIAKIQNRTLMVGHLLQYHSAFIKLQELVRDGKLGRLQYIYSNRLNLGKITRVEDILWSFAPHDISMILSLVDSAPDTVESHGSYYLHKSIADTTSTHLTFPTGEHAHIFVSWLHPFKEQKLVVIGEKGLAIFNDGNDWDEKLLFYPHSIKWKEGTPLPEKGDAEAIQVDVSEPLKNECLHFIDCFENGNTPKTDGAEGIRVLKVLTQASLSLQKAKLPKVPARPALGNSDYYAHETATVDQPAKIGKGTKVWHYSHILGNTKIGGNCTIGQNVMIGPDVVVGDRCKIQNNVSLYKGVTLEDGVFCGPSCVFTNVHTPRAEVERKDEFRETYVEKGATIGANATINSGNRLGAYCFIGSGAVVTKDIAPHALVVGNPARQVGWVSHSGEKLSDDLICPREGRQYRINEQNQLEEITDAEPGLKAAG